MSYVSTDIKKIIAEIIENKKEKGGVKNIYFVGCGGSLGALYPAKTFMEREAQVLRSAWINSNEFVHSTPKDFGENSIICLACHKGNTPETIQAAKLGKEKAKLVKQVCLESNQFILQGLSKKEQREIIHLLKQMNNTLEKEDTHGNTK